MGQKCGLAGIRIWKRSKCKLHGNISVLIPALNCAEEFKDCKTETRVLNLNSRGSLAEVNVKVNQKHLCWSPGLSTPF